jgi:hypothetical protein
VMKVVYVPVLIAVNGVFIRKQYHVRLFVQVVSVLVERRLIVEKFISESQFAAQSDFMEGLKVGVMFTVVAAEVGECRMTV